MADSLARSTCKKRAWWPHSTARSSHHRTSASPSPLRSHFPTPMSVQRCRSMRISTSGSYRSTAAGRHVNKQLDNSAHTVPKRPKNTPKETPTTKRAIKINHPKHTPLSACKRRNTVVHTGGGGSSRRRGYLDKALPPRPRPPICSAPHPPFHLPPHFPPQGKAWDRARRKAPSWRPALL